MILVDTSVWIGHLRSPDRWLLRLLEDRSVLGHPFVLGELALGRLPDRAATLRRFAWLPQARSARAEEVLDFIERHALAGSGVGYVDAHLLAAVALTPPARLWSADRRLADAAQRLGLAMSADGGTPGSVSLCFSR